MYRLICLAFGFLGFAFFVLSGGASFDAEMARETAIAARGGTESTDAPARTPSRAETPAPPVDTVRLRLTPFDQVAPAPAARIETPPAEAAPPIVFPPTSQRAASGGLGDTSVRYVSGDQVNLRNGPGTVYGVVTKLERGTAVTVLESNGAGWVRLRTVDGQSTGWIADFLLRAN